MALMPVICWKKAMASAMNMMKRMLAAEQPAQADAGSLLRKALRGCCAIPPPPGPARTTW